MIIIGTYAKADTSNQPTRLISPNTDRVWMVRNVGATSTCISDTDSECFGDYYQWGRRVDGHQRRDSFTTTNLLADAFTYPDTLLKGIGTEYYKFVLTPTDDLSNPGYDWTSDDANDRDSFYRYQNRDAYIPTTRSKGSIDVPWAEGEIYSCDRRPPTKAEFEAEINGPHGIDFLKLPLSGRRNHATGEMEDVGKYGYIWTEDADKKLSITMVFNHQNSPDSFVGFIPFYRSYGLNLRCIDY